MKKRNAPKIGASMDSPIYWRLGSERKSRFMVVASAFRYSTNYLMDQFFDAKFEEFVSERAAQLRETHKDYTAKPYSD